MARAAGHRTDPRTNARGVEDLRRDPPEGSPSLATVVGRAPAPVYGQAYGCRRPRVTSRPCGGRRHHDRPQRICDPIMEPRERPGRRPFAVCARITWFHPFAALERLIPTTD